MDKDNNLDEFRKSFEKLKKEYNLPDFTQLGEDFDIERASEKETSFILRDIRRVIAEKIYSCLHLFEMLINPSNPPMFIFSMLKNIKEEDRKKIKEIYTELSKIELGVIKLDIIYSEKKEAKFIIESSKMWDKLKTEISELIEKLSVEKSDNASTSAYFG